MREKGSRIPKVNNSMVCTTALNSGGPQDSDTGLLLALLPLSSLSSSVSCNKENHKGP